MRIWVLTNEYEDNFIGGLGVVATQIVKDLHEKGNEIIVLCKTKKRRVDMKNGDRLQVIRFPQKSKYMTPIRNIFLTAPIDEYLKKRGIKPPDLIHVHSLQCHRLATYYKKKYRVPVIYTCHSLVTQNKKIKTKPSLSLQQQRNLFRTADAVTVPSLWLKNEIKKHYRNYKKSIQVIPNGVHIPDHGMVETAMINHYKKRNHPINHDRLLFVGRLHSVKGIEELIRAIAIIKKKKPWVRLYIVGEGSVYYTKKLKDIVNKLGLRPNIRWLGKIQPEKVQKMYSSFSAVIVPSKSESFGLVALEVMASGVPLIATRRGGLASFVNQKNSTIIMDVTPHSISRGILRMWRDPAINTKIVNAFLTAQKYEWRNSAEKYKDLFDMLVKK